MPIGFLIGSCILLICGCLLVLTTTPNHDENDIIAYKLQEMKMKVFLLMLASIGAIVGTFIELVVR